MKQRKIKFRAKVHYYGRPCAHHPDAAGMRYRKGWRCVICVRTWANNHTLQRAIARRKANEEYRAWKAEQAASAARRLAAMLT